MVQLKASVASLTITSLRIFQFLNGTIKRVEKDDSRI